MVILEAVVVKKLHKISRVSRNQKFLKNFDLNKLKRQLASQMTP